MPDRYQWLPLVGAGFFVLALQATAAHLFSVGSLTPNLCVLATVAVGVSQGALNGAAVGASLGLGLDFTPPMDHTIGLWAGALALTGLCVGLALPSSRPALVSSVVLCGWASLLATSVYALAALYLGDLTSAVPEVLRVVLGNVAYDLALGAVLIWPLILGVGRVWPTEPQPDAPFVATS